LKRIEELSNEKNQILKNNNEAEIRNDESVFLEKAEQSPQKIQKKKNSQNNKKSKYKNKQNSDLKLKKQTDLSKLIKSNSKKAPILARKLEVKYIPNNTLNRKMKNIDSYAKCQTKTGVLNLVKSQDQLPYTLNLFPVYVYLGLSTLNIYKNKNSSSLMTTIKLLDILRVNQRGFLKDKFCFDLILSDAVKMKLDNGDLISLCSENKEGMEKWIQALLEFKECQVDIKKLSKNDEVVVDYKKVDELLKQKTFVQSPKQKLKSLYYDGSNKAYIKSGQTISKQMRINSIVQNIMNTMKEGNIRTNQVRRQLANKLKKARGFTQDISKKEEIIREMVEKRIEKERQKEVANFSTKQRKKEIELLKAVQQRIIQLKKQEINEYSSHLVKEIKVEKEKASKQAKNMMKMLIDAKKLRPYDDCTDNRLLNFENMVYVKSTCKRHYGEHVNFFLIFDKILNFKKILIFILYIK